MNEKLINDLKTYVSENEDIKFDIYSGYSFIHIDIIYKGKATLFSTVNTPAEGNPTTIKLCSFDENCTETETDIILLEELIKIGKTIGLNEIYGRAKILKNKEQSKKFYEAHGFTFNYKPKDKTYLSAIISKNI